MGPTEQYRTYLNSNQNSRKNLHIEQTNIERKSKNKTCNAHAPYFHLWPVRLYNISPHYLTNGTIFETKKVTEHKMCVLFSSTIFDGTFLILEFKLAKCLQLIGTIFKKVRTETILKIYNTLVLPTFLYGSEN